MSKKTYTKEERAEYMKALRQKWQENKALAEQDNDAKAKWEAMRNEAPEGSMSYYGFFFALHSMRAQGLDGLPYVDAKTYNGWKVTGFQVKRGENSKIDGITWKRAKTKDKQDDDEGVLYPKMYALFHRSQVENA